MKVLGKIAMAPVWVLLFIAAAPFVLLGVVGQSLDKISPDGSIPKRRDGESLVRFCMKVAAWVILTAIVILFAFGWGSNHDF